jgi:ABC-2 type transport system ATP-binding protein
MLQAVGLDPTSARRYPHEFSGGQLRRLALARILLLQPRVLILDEPTSGLDPLVQQSFYELVREARGEGRTVFLSSHILSEVERTADRVAIIRDGVLVKVDSVEGLRDLAHHQVELRFAGPVPTDVFEHLPGVSEVAAQDHVLRMRVSGPITPVVRAAAQYELLDFVSREPTLEETFLAQYGRGDAAMAAPGGAATPAGRA